MDANKLWNSLVALSLAAILVYMIRPVWVNSEEEKVHLQDQQDIAPYDGLLMPQSDIGSRTKILSQRFHVQESVVLDLRSQKLDWDEITQILAISAKSGQNVNVILALKQSKIGWKKIAQKYNLSLDQINKDIRATRQAMEEAIEDHHRDSDDKAKEHRTEREEISETQETGQVLRSNLSERHRKRLESLPQKKDIRNNLNN